MKKLIITTLIFGLLIQGYVSIFGGSDGTDEPVNPTNQPKKGWVYGTIEYPHDVLTPRDYFMLLRAHPKAKVPMITGGYATTDVYVKVRLRGVSTPRALQNPDDRHRLLAGHPVLGLALGSTMLFASSFDNPINDALAQQAGIHQAQQRATDLGRRSAVDLKDNFERGFVAETARQTAAPASSQNSDTAPIVMNEIKLIIGGQEIKALYEETQRQIATGIISE